MKVEKSTINHLLMYFLDYTFTDKLLSNVSAGSFDSIKSELFGHFEELELTEDDIKETWKSWFDAAANGGTLISPFMCFAGCKELDVIDKVIELACEAIDNL